MRIRLAVRLLALAAACLAVQLTLASTAVGFHNNPAPTNDRSENAEVIQAQSTPYIRDNIGAHLEDEDDYCNDAEAFLDSDVWFYFSAPAPGKASFGAEGGGDVDTVSQVYRAGEASPAACADDGVGVRGSSVSVYSDHAQGYYLQIGGYFSSTFYEEGEFALSVSFEEDCDLDNDGVNGRCSGATDCSDRNPNIRPGAGEAVNNNVDENCDGLLAFDADGDGARIFRRTSGVGVSNVSGADCNDGNPNIRPGARSVRGNEVDEDCDGNDPGFFLPRSAALLQGKTLRNGFRVKRVRITQIPRGSRVKVTACKRRGRCRTQTRKATAPEAIAAVDRSISRLGRIRKGGSVLVRVTHRDYLTQATRFTIRSGQRAPRRSVTCVNPFRNKRASCE